MTEIENLKTAINNFVIKDKRERYISFISSAKNINKFYKDLNHKLELFLVKNLITKKTDAFNKNEWIIAGHGKITKSTDTIDDIVKDCESKFGGFLVTNFSGDIAVFIGESPANIIYLKK